MNVKANRQLRDALLRALNIDNNDLSIQQLSQQVQTERPDLIGYDSDVGERYLALEGDDEVEMHFLPLRKGEKR
jgi:hypothetical protein